MTLNQIIGNKERISRIDTELWKKMNEKYSSNNSEEKNQENNTNSQNTNSQKDKIITSYSLVECGSYAMALAKLQDELDLYSSKIHPTHPTSIENPNTIYRPLTYKENVEAIIDDYETLNYPDNTPRDMNNREKLLNVGLNSCTGIAYKKNSDKFKISRKCHSLITLDDDFNEEFKSILYDIYPGMEFDSTDSTKGIYNSVLSKEQFLEHEVYRYLYDDDVSLMNKYWEIVQESLHSTQKTDFLFELEITANTQTDELRNLYQYSQGRLHNTMGSSNLNNITQFIVKKQV